MAKGSLENASISITTWYGGFGKTSRINQCELFSALQRCGIHQKWKNRHDKRRNRIRESEREKETRSIKR